MVRLAAGFGGAKPLHQLLGIWIGKRLHAFPRKTESNLWRNGLKKCDQSMGVAWRGTPFEMMKFSNGEKGKVGSGSGRM